MVSRATAGSSVFGLAATLKALFGEIQEEQTTLEHERRYRKSSRCSATEAKLMAEDEKSV